MDHIGVMRVTGGGGGSGAEGVSGRANLVIGQSVGLATGSLAAHRVIGAADSALVIADDEDTGDRDVTVQLTGTTGGFVSVTIRFAPLDLLG